MAKRKENPPGPKDELKRARRPYHSPEVTVSTFQRFFMVCNNNSHACLGGPYQQNMKCM